MARAISAALARRTHKNARERSPMLKGLLRIRRYQQETPCALQEADVRSWLRFGEAYSALRDWRPIPAALLSHSVVQCSGTEEFLPTTTAIHLQSPPSGNKLPRQTTKYKEENVQCQIIFETSTVENQGKIGTLAPPLPGKFRISE
jgi:hypothetical protein